MKYLSPGSYFLVLILCYCCPLSGFSQNSKLSDSDWSEKKWEPLSDHTTLTKGQTRCFSGSGILDDLVIDGGTLLITGKVRFKKLTILKGNILISKTGTAIFPSLVFNGNSSLINDGSVTFTGNISLSGHNNDIVNHTPDSKMNWGSAKFIFGGKRSEFINNGTSDIGTLILDSKTGKIFLGPNSLTNVVNLVNNYENRIYIPKGIAKLSQAGFADLPKTLTNNPNLIVCPGPSSDIHKNLQKSGGYGHANVMEKGCTSFPLLTNQTLTSYK